MNAVDETRLWVERVVVGLDLCPFASAPMQAGTIHYAESRAQTWHEMLADLLAEVSALGNPDGPQTSLLVLSGATLDFSEYLDLFAAAEALLEETGHARRYQLVSFHPQYQFAETAPDDPANHTNRSPYPTIHILRRADVARAIQTHPDTTSIPEQNVKRLRTLGVAVLSRLLSE